MHTDVSISLELPSETVSERTGTKFTPWDVHRAQMASHLTLALGVVLSLLNIAFIIGFREKLPYLFTADADLIMKAKDLFLVVALYQLPDAINCVDQGIFRTTGQQSLSAKLNFIAYYIVGIPMGCVLGTEGSNEV